jgi:hypothetical protein
MRAFALRFLRKSALVVRRLFRQSGPSMTVHSMPQSCQDLPYGCSASSLHERLIHFET